jgi:hypothetical protein
MITSTGLEKAAQVRLAHSAFYDADGSIRLVLGDGSAVRLTARQWAQAQGRFADAIAPANRGLKWVFILAIPVMIATLSVMSVFKLGKAIDALGPAASIASVFTTLCWWPLLILFLHWRAIGKARRDFDTQFAGLPPAPVPEGRPRALQALEIVALILFGPAVLLDIIGSIWPHVLDGTPFMGWRLTPFSIAGIAAVAAIFIAPRFRHR